MALALEFANLNTYANLEFLAFKTPEELQDAIRKFRGQVRMLAIYFDGKNHVAWLQTSVPIRKIVRSK